MWNTCPNPLGRHPDKGLKSVHVRLMFGSRGGTGGPDHPPPPLKNHKNTGFLRNSGLDPLKIAMLPSQHSIFDHHRHTSETPFKWRFAGWPMMARLQWYLDPPFPHQLKNIGPPLTKLSRSAHGCQTVQIRLTLTNVYSKGPRTVSYSICPNFDSLWLG